MGVVMAYAVDFAAPPPVSTQITYRGELAEVVEVVPFTRRTDGAPTFLLRWQIGDRRATSGLRANSVMWSRPEDDDA